VDTDRDREKVNVFRAIMSLFVTIDIVIIKVDIMNEYKGNKGMALFLSPRIYITGIDISVIVVVVTREREREQ